MNRSLVVHLIRIGLVVWLGCALAAQAPEAPAGEGPVLAAADRYHDAGRVPAAGPPIVHTFTIANTGTAPLNILEVESMCECARFNLGANRLAPQETTTLEIVLDVRDKRGSFYDGVWLVTDDPRQPRVAFYIVGDAYTRLDVTPAVLSFAMAPKDDVNGAAAELAVEINDDAIHALQSVSVSSPIVIAAFTPVDDRRYRVSVRLQVAEAEVMLDEWVELVFNGQVEERVRVPVRGLVTGPIQPSTRYLDLLDFAQSTPPERVVYLWDSVPFTVTRVATPPWLSAAALPLQRTVGGKTVHVQKITFRLDPDAALPAQPPTQLVVHTDHPASPRVILTLEDRRHMAGLAPPADPAAPPPPR